MKLRSNILSTSALAVVMALSACGGGGGDGLADANPPAPAPEVLDPGFVADATTGKVILYSAKGDLQKYIGKWESGCTLAEVKAFNPVRSFINVYQLTSIQETTVRGKFTQFQFTDLGCTFKASPSKVDSDVTLSSIREETISSGTLSFAGFLDSMRTFYTGLTFFDRPDFAAFSEGYQYLLIGREQNYLRSKLLEGVVYTKK